MSQGYDELDRLIAAGTHNVDGTPKRPDIPQRGQGIMIFDQVDPWPFKLNVVDENNVLVGFDMESQCCEWYGWCITEDPDTAPLSYEFGDNGVRGDHDLTQYRFDAGWRPDLSHPTTRTFRLLAKAKLDWDHPHHNANYDLPVLYLHLHCDHNGYYAHGFEYTNGYCQISDAI